jgi:CheY-like chemotaxis protein
MTGPARGASILIVDDEPELASLLAEILADDAHRVETAYNGLRSTSSATGHTASSSATCACPISTVPGSTARSHGAILR